MTEISDVLSGIEGLAPEAIAAIEGFIRSKENELVQNLETKYGVKPEVISDVESAVTAAAPSVEKAAEAQSPSLQDLLSRLSSLEQQNKQLQEQISNPEQTIAPGSGDPVPHNLFLDDGSVIKNHAGLATQVSSTDDQGNEVIRKVVAAYPA